MKWKDIFKIVIATAALTLTELIGRKLTEEGEPELRGQVRNPQQSQGKAETAESQKGNAG